MYIATNALYITVLSVGEMQYVHIVMELNYQQPLHN